MTKRTRKLVILGCLAVFSLVFADCGMYMVYPDGDSAEGKTYTVFLNKEEDGLYAEPIYVTFGKAMPKISPPVKSGYSFGGYWQGRGGTGDQYYKADGSSAMKWNIAGDASLYAYWTSGASSR